MSKLNNWALRKFVQFKHRDEEGQGLAEYGLILALVAIVAIGALTLLGTNVSTKINSVATAI